MGLREKKGLRPAPEALLRTQTLLRLTIRVRAVKDFLGIRDAVKTITEAGGHVSEPSPELHKFMQDAGKRSWKLFYDTVPNAKEILDSADSYRQAK